jgi:hypothetical protein
MNSIKSLKMIPRRPSFLKWVVLGMFLFIFPAMQAAAANVDIKPVKISFDSRNRTEKLMLKNVSDTGHQSDNQNHLQSDSDPADCGCSQLLPDSDRNDNMFKILQKRRIDHEF